MEERVSMGKKRRPNWTFSEVQCLVDRVDANNSLLFSKHSNVCTNSQKDDVWLKIAFGINGIGGNNRTADECSAKWTYIKSETKKKEKERMRQTKVTGGGTVPPNLNDTELKILNLIPAESLTGIPGLAEVSGKGHTIVVDDDGDDRNLDEDEIVVDAPHLPKRPKIEPKHKLVKPSIPFRQPFRQLDSQPNNQHKLNSQPKSQQSKPKITESTSESYLRQQTEIMREYVDLGKQQNELLNAEILRRTVFDNGLLNILSNFLPAATAVLKSSQEQTSDIEKLLQQISDREGTNNSQRSSCMSPIIKMANPEDNIY